MRAAAKACPILIKPPQRTKMLIDKTFAKFVLVGIANTLFGTAVMFAFYNLLHCSYWVSSAANYFFGSILSYFLNKYYTFENHERSWKIVLKFTVNIIVCYLVAYAVAKPLTILALSGQTKVVQENVAMLVGTCLFIALNYLGQRFWAFKKKG